MSMLQENNLGLETTVAILNKQQVDGNSDNPFSDELATILQWITFSVLCQVVSLFGVGSNIVNIICFVKQGLQDPINVSFLGLAVADMASLVTIIWSNLCLSPAFIAADLSFEPIEFQYLVSGMPHATFTSISSLITAMITMERCLCIIAPTKVKSVVTSKRVSHLIVGIFVIPLASLAPIYVIKKLDWKFYPEKNKTLIGMIIMGNRESVEKVSYLINNVCIPFGAFIIIIVSTITLVIQLRKTAKWRKTSTLSVNADNVSIRNQKVARMVVMISALFITSFAPLSIFFVAMSLEPELSVVGKYRNALLIFVGVGALLESINSSSNIFIYFRMSSKYKTTFRQSCCFSCKR